MISKEKVIDRSSVKCGQIASMLRLLSDINTSSIINGMDLADTALYLAQELDQIAETLEAANALKH